MPQSQQARDRTPFKILRVVDGDSFTAEFNGRRAPCRLYGADAPELDQPYGRSSHAWLKNLCLNKILMGSIVTIDCYNRTVVDLWAITNIRVALRAILSGYAWHTPRWSPDRPLLAAAQTAAKQNRNGLWELEDPIPPWTWRRLHHIGKTILPTSRRRRIRRP